MILNAISINLADDKKRVHPSDNYKVFLEGETTMVEASLEKKANGQNKSDENLMTVTMPPDRRVDAFQNLRHSMNRLFDDFTFGWNVPAMFEKTSAIYMPRVNVEETQNQLVYTAELPGIDSKDIEVNLVRDSLVIKGEKKEEKEERTIGYHRVERSYGSFERVLPVPCEVDEEKVEADYKDGVLKIVLAKTKNSKHGIKKIKVNTK
jgi:HSP20 family protein